MCPLSPNASPFERIRYRTSGVEHFAGGPLAGAYRPVHVAVPDLRGLRARPMDAAYGLPQRLAVAGPHARPEAPPVASPTPFFGRPVSLDVFLGVRGARSEELREDGEDQLLALLGMKLCGSSSVPPFQEAEEHAAAKIRRRVVEDDANLVFGGKDRSGEPFGAPERLGVGYLHLDDVAHGHLLGELVSQGRQRRRVADPAG